jgi:hypothetical protein
MELDTQTNSTHFSSSTSSTSSNFEKPSVYVAAMVKLEESVPHILDDFKKQYISYHKNSQNTESSNLFEQIKSNVEQQNTAVFVLTNAIEKGIEDLNHQLFILNKKIQIEKKANQQMKKILGKAENEYNGSDEMINDYKKMYDFNYFRNFIMILGILLGGTLLSKVFVTAKKV